MVTLGPLLEMMAKVKRKCLSPGIAFIQWAVSCCQLSWGLILWVWSVLHFWQGCLSLESKVIFSTREIFHERVLSFDLSGVLSHLKRLCKLFLLTLSSVFAQIYTFDLKTCSYILIFAFANLQLWTEFRLTKTWKCIFFGHLLATKNGIWTKKRLRTLPTHNQEK